MRPPVVGTPVVVRPDPQTGVVTGSIVATDPDGDTLTYTVTTGPKYGIGDGAAATGRSRTRRR